MELERLKDAVEQIVLSEDAKERILDLEGRRLEMRRQRNRMRKGIGIICAAFVVAVCAVLLPAMKSPKWSVTAYAQGIDGAQWVRLKPGERVLLQKEEDVAYYRLKLDLPEYYYYEKSGLLLGQDRIWAKGEEIYWLTDQFFYTDTEKETGYKLPDKMSTFMYIKILDEDNRVVDTIRMEVSKEYDKCYVQLD